MKLVGGGLLMPHLGNCGFNLNSLAYLWLIFYSDLTYVSYIIQFSSPAGLVDVPTLVRQRSPQSFHRSCV
jgi:hypothetical protein